MTQAGPQSDSAHSGTLRYDTPEEALALFRATMEYAPEAVFILASDGGFFFVNERACRSLGYSHEELMKLKLWDIDPYIHQESWASIWEGFRDDKAGGVQQAESLHRRIDGRVFPVDISTHHFWLGDTDYHIAFVRDISERKRAEEALRMYQFFMEHAPDAVFLMTSTAGFTYVNQKACLSLGYTREELLQLTLWDIDPFFPKAQWDEIIASQVETVFVETLHRRKDGTIFPVEVSAKHLWLADADYHVAFVRDISERKQAQAAIQEREARFRTLFEESTDAILLGENGVFIDCNQAAVDMMRAADKSQLLSLHPSSISPEYQPDGRRSDEKAREMMEIALRKGNHRFEWLHRRSDGSEFHVEVILTKIHLGEHEVIHGIWRDISDRKRAEEALKRYEFAMDNAPDAVYFINRDGSFSYVNNQACASLGYSRDELMRLTLWDIDPVFEKAQWEEIWTRHKDRELAAANLEVIHRRKDGSTFPVEVSAKHLWLDNQELHVAFARDLTERKQAEEELRQLAAVVKNTAEAVMITDADKRIIAVNHAFSEVTGYTEKEALGHDPSLLKSHHHGPDFYRDMWASIDRTGLWQGEVWDRHKNGEVFPAWSTISAVRDVNNKIINYVSVFSDISTLKRSQEQLNFLAHHDPLTHLPNRLLFNDRLEQALRRAEREAHHVAVLFLDLDRFKNINDSLGHPVGDVLLQEASKRLTELVRREDTVARLGGDEFIILIEEIDDPQDVAHLAKKITEAFGRPFSVRGHELHLTVSLGISLHPQDGEDSATLIRNADAAMYRAKEDGRNTYEFYTSALTTAALERLLLENALRHALHKNELMLYYQPQYQLSTGQLVGAEALLRWRHPDLGLVSPSRFIPLAEDSGIIESIGEWVLRAACEQMQHWLRAGLMLKRMAVNLSIIQCQRGDIVRAVEHALKATGLNPRQLELEITEGLVMQKTEWTLGVLGSLEQLGVNIAIDDFGTGYSSLAYLKRLPVSKLKIDRSFVRDIPHNANDEAIARAVVALGKSLKLDVIAEGVETKEQHAFFKAIGCDEAQGYLYGHPVAAMEFIQYFARPPLFTEQ